jgi:hypothetical protein
MTFQNTRLKKRIIFCLYGCGCEVKELFVPLCSNVCVLLTSRYLSYGSLTFAAYVGAHTSATLLY